jgi:branched-chain amino acid aminotransferase
MSIVYVDGKWLPKEEAMVSVFDHGLLYGDGVFEGIRAYGGKIFRLREHLERLYDSAKAIWLTIPVEFDELMRLHEEGLKKSGLTDSYIRTVITRGAGDLGLDPRKCKSPTVIIIIDKIALWPEERYTQGLTVVTASTPTPHRESLSPRVKSLNYLPHILAKIEGIVANADEVVMLDAAGFVAEGSGANLFVVRRGELSTPAVHSGILRGVTRDAVIELAHAAKISVHETTLNRFDLYTADEVFYTGTGAELIHARMVDGRLIGNGGAGKVTVGLRDAFRKLVRAG